MPLKEMAVVLLSRGRAHKEWQRFLESARTEGGYDVYVVSDEEPDGHAPEDVGGVTVIRVASELCREAGYVGSCTSTFSKSPISWDKAIYYFSVVCTRHKHVWFLEDDVLVGSPRALLDIDSRQVGTDLVCRGHNSWPGWYHWNPPPGTEPSPAEVFPSPRFSSMVCAVRCSRELLRDVKAHVANFGRLHFIEYMFNTLAHHAGRIVRTDAALSEVHYRIPEESFEDHLHRAAKLGILHPVKDQDAHHRFRELWATNDAPFP